MFKMVSQEVINKIINPLILLILAILIFIFIRRRRKGKGIGIFRRKKPPLEQLTVEIIIRKIEELRTLKESIKSEIKNIQSVKNKIITDEAVKNEFLERIASKKGREFLFDERKIFTALEKESDLYSFLEKNLIAFTAKLVRAEADFLDELNPWRAFLEGRNINVHNEFVQLHHLIWLDDDSIGKIVKNLYNSEEESKKLAKDLRKLLENKVKLISRKYDRFRKKEIRLEVVNSDESRLIDQLCAKIDDQNNLLWDLIRSIEDAIHVGEIGYDITRRMPTPTVAAETEEQRKVRLINELIFKVSQKNAKDAFKELNVAGPTSLGTETYQVLIKLLQMFMKAEKKLGMDKDRVIEEILAYLESEEVINNVPHRNIDTLHEFMRREIDDIANQIITLIEDGSYEAARLRVEALSERYFGDARILLLEIIENFITLQHFIQTRDTDNIHTTLDLINRKISSQQTMIYLSQQNIQRLQACLEKLSPRYKFSLFIDEFIKIIEEEGDKKLDQSWGLLEEKYRDGTVNDATMEILDRFLELLVGVYEHIVSFNNILNFLSSDTVMDSLSQDDIIKLRNCVRRIETKYKSGHWPKGVPLTQRLKERRLSRREILAIGGAGGIAVGGAAIGGTKLAKWLTKKPKPIAPPPTLLPQPLLDPDLKTVITKTDYQKPEKKLNIEFKIIDEKKKYKFYRVIFHLESVKYGDFSTPPSEFRPNIEIPYIILTEKLPLDRYDIYIEARPVDNLKILALREAKTIDLK